MATNKILPWAQTGTANVLSDDAYAADLATGGLYDDGVKTGQASSQQANKTWRQATAPAAGLGQFLVDNLSVDVTDADTPATFSARIANAVLKLAQISPFNQSFATATGGYRKYAIVSDSSGNFWVSTADQNVTVPGDSGAKWQSLFDGYATQAWSNNQFVKNNKGTDGGITALDLGTIGNLTFLRADGTWGWTQPAGDYATNPALNTEITNRTNADTDLQNQINNLTSELPTSGTITGGTYTKIGNVLRQVFTLYYSSNTALSFPISFSGKPNVSISSATQDNEKITTQCNVYDNTITNGGFTAQCVAIRGNTQTGISCMITVIAEGPV